MRLLLEEDRDTFVMLHTDDVVMNYNGGALSAAKADAKFNSCLKLNSQPTLTFKTWIVLNKKTKEKVGVCMLFVNKEFTSPHPEAGIILNKKAQGNKYSIEILLALISFTFNEIKQCKLLCKFLKKSKASKALVDNIGFSYIQKKETASTYTVYFDKAEHNV